MPGSPGEAEGGTRERFRSTSKKIRDHRDLRVWRGSRKLAQLCATAVASFPATRQDLARVICRLADEVPDEIAAGQGQRHHAAYMDHLGRARRALQHLERRLIEAHKVHCLESTIGDPLLARLAEIDRMLKKLMVSLELSHARRGVRQGGE